MTLLLIGLAGLMLAAPTAATQNGFAPVYRPGHAPAGACEIRLDAPYINPRLPLGRAAYAHRPACRTTWAPGPAGPGVYVQGPPVQVEAPPVRVAGVLIYLVPPEIVVLPSEVTIEPPQFHGAEVETRGSAVPEPGD
jgi:hypothetical protein